ncbi:MAG: type II toxin-antitoxin system RelE/ParE family toxin [Patescibacteria group bacterium]|nr:type II toxin-antitoxin system RelE/ParE family toxin [Patescibacteria group bacterium]
MQIHIDPEVEEFISSLEKSTIAKTLRTLDLLEKFTFNLSMPHSKKVANDLFELRVRGQQEVRIFYCFQKGTIYLLSGFIKKTQKTPPSELAKARNKCQNLTS